jgi:hypothetical protein
VLFHSTYIPHNDFAISGLFLSHAGLLTSSP